MNGMILWLKKRHHASLTIESTSTSRVDAPTFHMWGYYDFLTVEEVHEWKNFDPAHMPRSVSSYPGDCGYTEETVGVEGISVFHEEFPLKLITPRDCCDGKSGAFDYSWNKEEHGPFIVIGMLHFSGTALNYLLDECLDLPNLNEKLQEAIILHAQKLWPKDAMDRLASLHCATYYTTGFADMVIVARTTQLDWAADLIHSLRVWTASNSAPYYLLSTSYMISGISSDYEMDDRRYPCLEADTKDLRLSIRFILKPGLTVNSFYDRLRDRLRENIKDEKWKVVEKHFPEIDRVQNECDVKIENDHNRVHGNLLSLMFGNSDSMLLPNIRPFPFLHEYTDDKYGIMNHDSDFYKENIASTRSSMRRIPSGNPFLCGHNPTIIEHERKKLVEQQGVLRGQLNELIKSVDGYYRDRNRVFSYRNDVVSFENSPRINQGLKQTLELYWDLAQAEHSYDIRCMLDPVLESLKHNVDLARNVLAEREVIISDLAIAIEGLDKELAGKPDLARDKDFKNALEQYNSQLLGTQKSLMSYLYNNDITIEYFRHELNELLIDLSRTDRQFIEGRTMLHKAIGSATKLILTFSRLLQHFILLAQDETHHKDSTYTFFLSSGGILNTQAKLLFKHIDPKLTDCGGGDGFTVEEHRLLQLRLPERTLFRPGAAVYLILHEALHFVGYRSPRTRARLMRKALLKYAVHNLVRAVVDLKEVVERSTDARSIEDSIVGLIEKELEPIEGYRTYSVKLEQILRDQIIETFKPRYYSDHEDALAKRIAQKIRILHAEIVEKTMRAMEAEGRHAAAEVIRHTILTEPTDQFRGFHLAYDKLIGNHYHSMPDDSPSGILSNQLSSVTYNINASVDEYMSAFQEAFVDVTTSLYLNASTAQFLSIFLHENETFSNILKLTPEVILRFGGILYTHDVYLRDAICAKNDGKAEKLLTKRLAQIRAELLSMNICNATQRRKKSIDHYVEHIGEMLRQFRRNYHQTGISEPLYEYLQECKEYHEKRIADILAGAGRNKLLNIRKLFHNGFHLDDAAHIEIVWNRLLSLWVDTMVANGGVS